MHNKVKVDGHKKKKTRIILKRSRKRVKADGHNKTPDIIKKDYTRDNIKKKSE
jgi:predicted ABC-type ATPase